MGFAPGEGPVPPGFAARAAARRAFRTMGAQHAAVWPEDTPAASKDPHAAASRSTAWLWGDAWSQARRARAAQRAERKAARRTWLKEVAEMTREEGLERSGRGALALVDDVPMEAKVEAHAATDAHRLAPVDLAAPTLPGGPSDTGAPANLLDSDKGATAAASTTADAHYQPSIGSAARSEFRHMRQMTGAVTGSGSSHRSREADEVDSERESPSEGAALHQHPSSLHVRNVDQGPAHDKLQMKDAGVAGSDLTSALGTGFGGAALPLWLAAVCCGVLAWWFIANRHKILERLCRR